MKAFTIFIGMVLDLGNLMLVGSTATFIADKYEKKVVSENGA